MEPLTFFVFIVLFWTPSIILLIAGLLSFKVKTLRRTLLTLSFISFMIPWLLVLVSMLSDQIEIWNLTGTYYGKDNQSNTVTVEMLSDQKFTIKIENCPEDNLSGSWQYVSEYEAFLFHLSNSSTKITFSENYRADLMLKTDLKTNCSELKEVLLTKN